MDDDRPIDDLLAAKHALAARWLVPGAARASRARRMAEVLAAAGRHVHGVGIGRKGTAGRATDEACIRLFVARKLPRHLLSARDVLPAAIDGIPTDVVEAPPARLHGTVASPASRGIERSCTAGRKRVRRPLVAGVSVALHTVTAGTISAFVRSRRPGDDAEAVHLLSNNHVLADVDHGRTGDAVYQPGPYDGGTAKDLVARLTRAVPLRLGGRAANRVDCAMAALVAGVAYRPEVCSIGLVTEVAEARLGLGVRKHGRTTGLTAGIISDVAFDAIVEMDGDGGEARFLDQVRISRRAPFAAFGLGGDSGALVVTAGLVARAVGLYFAGPEDGSYGIANPIAEVLEALDVELVQ